MTKVVRKVGGENAKKCTWGKNCWNAYQITNNLTAMEWQQNESDLLNSWQHKYNKHNYYGTAP